MCQKCVLAFSTNHNLSWNILAFIGRKCVENVLTAGGSPQTTVGAITGEASPFGNGNVPARTTGKA